MPNVKGSVLRSRLDFVKGHFGDEGLSRLLASLSESDRTVLTDGLLPAQWYPFDLGERLDSGIMRTLGGGSPATFRRLGARSAELNLSGVHQVFVHTGDPHALLRRAPAIYKLYYDTGHRTYEPLGATSCRLVTHDSETFSEADCQTVIGWHERAVAMCGGRNPRVEHPRCRARGAPVCEYIVAWDAGADARGD